jgi:hypothetical protein
MRPNRDSLRTRDSELLPHGYVPQGDARIVLVRLSLFAHPRGSALGYLWE